MNKKRIKSLLIILLIVVITINYSGNVIAAQPPVNLGKTASFAILAGTTITNTGPTTISGSAGGNIGLFPGSDFTGQTSVTLNGSVHLTDVLANQAKTDLVAAYLDAAGRYPVTRIPSELGETTLIPGIYDSREGKFLITGKLTLDAKGNPNGVFIFKTDSTLITESGSTVNIINGAQTCRIFWQVGSSVTLGTNSTFVGHIFALTTITAKTGATIRGQLLARNGAVNLDNNTIINELCDINVPYTSDSTNSGGELPNTSTNLYYVIITGAVLICVGVIGLKIKKHNG